MNTVVLKTEEELQVLDKAELKAYALDSLGLELKGNLSEDTLIERILAKQDETVEDVKPTVVDEKPVSKKPVASERGLELNEALKDQIARGLKFELSDDGVSWHMSYRHHIVSGNVSVPNSLMLRQAETMLAR